MQFSHLKGDFQMTSFSHGIIPAVPLGACTLLQVPCAAGICLDHEADNPHCEWNPAAGQPLLTELRMRTNDAQPLPPVHVVLQPEGDRGHFLRLSSVLRTDSFYSPPARTDPPTLKTQIGSSCLSGFQIQAVAIDLARCIQR